jgi:hypothetical protein
MKGSIGEYGKQFFKEVPIEFVTQTASLESYNSFFTTNK